MVQIWPGILHAKREWYVCVELLQNNGMQWTDQETDTYREYARRKKKKAGGHTSRCVAAILYGPPLLFGFGQNSVL